MNFVKETFNSFWSLSCITAYFGKEHASTWFLNFSSKQMKRHPCERNSPLPLGQNKYMSLFPLYGIAEIKG